MKAFSSCAIAIVAGLAVPRLAAAQASVSAVVRPAQPSGAREGSGSSDAVRVRFGIGAMGGFPVYYGVYAQIGVQIRRRAGIYVRSAFTYPTGPGIGGGAGLFADYAVLPWLLIGGGVEFTYGRARVVSDAEAWTAAVPARVSFVTMPANAGDRRSAFVGFIEAGPCLYQTTGFRSVFPFVSSGIGFETF